MYGQELPNDDPAEETPVFPYSEEECKSIIFLKTLSSKSFP